MCEKPEGVSKHTLGMVDGRGFLVEYEYVFEYQTAKRGTCTPEVHPDKRECTPGVWRVGMHACVKKLRGWRSV